MLSIICRVQRAAMTEIINSYKIGYPDSVFQHTLSPALQRIGLLTQLSKNILALTANHRQQYLQLANEHQNWTLEEW